MLVKGAPEENELTTILIPQEYILVINKTALLLQMTWGHYVSHWTSPDITMSYTGHRTKTPGIYSENHLLLVKLNSKYITDNTTYKRILIPCHWNNNTSNKWFKMADDFNSRCHCTVFNMSYQIIKDVDSRINKGLDSNVMEQIPGGGHRLINCLICN